MIRALLDRRVPQFVALYVVGAWGFVQFVDWVVEQYLLSPALTNLVVALLLLFLPTVVVLAWRYGAPGDDRWKATDVGVIGMNAILGVAIAYGLFREADLGRTAEVRLIENPEGEMVERTVAEPEFRRRILAFNLANETGDPELDWLGPGVSFGLAVDAGQDPFVLVSNVVGPSSEQAYTIGELRERGLDPEDDLPVALMRDLSRAQGMDYFLGGTIERGDGDSLVVRTRLHEAESARVVAERSYSLADPLAAADRISVDLRRDIGIPEFHIESTPDLPAAEIVTQSPEAYRAILDGLSAMSRRDVAGLSEAAQRAVASDSTAVAGHQLAGFAAMVQGDREAAVTALRRALAFDYRLPERWRLGLQVGAHMLEGDLDAAERTARYWSEAYPGDPEAHRMLARIYETTGYEEGRLRELRAVVAIDPSYLEAKRSLARALLNEGDFNSAIEAYRELATLQSGNTNAQLDVASALQAAGRLDAAREAYEQARVMEPRDPDPTRLLGVLELRAGNRERAEALRAEAGTMARTPRERERLAGFDETLCYLAGQFDCLEAAYRERLQLVSIPELNTPNDVLHEINDSEFLMYASEAGREAEARAQIDSLAGTANDWSARFSIYQAAAYLAVFGRDLEAARTVLGRMRELSELSEEDPLRDANPWFPVWLEGHIAWWEDGDCRRALPSLEELLELTSGGRFGRWALLRCYAELERWDEAQEIAEWYMAREPGWVPFRLEIARYHAARGQTDEALGHLEFVLDAWAEADPAYRPAREARLLRDELTGRTAAASSPD